MLSTTPPLFLFALLPQPFTTSTLPRRTLTLVLPLLFLPSYNSTHAPRSSLPTLPWQLASRIGRCSAVFIVSHLKMRITSSSTAPHSSISGTSTPGHSSLKLKALSRTLPYPPPCLNTSSVLPLIFFEMTPHGPYSPPASTWDSCHPFYPPPSPTRHSPAHPIVFSVVLPAPVTFMPSDWLLEFGVQYSGIIFPLLQSPLPEDHLPGSPCYATDT